MRWRLLYTPALPAVENMALDAALMERARRTPGERVFRVYTWRRPTLSLGRNQTARGLYDPAQVRARGADVVRRPTGGRAVLHHREVTYSVTGAVTADETLRDAYTAINRLLLDGLRRLGVHAELARPTTRAPSPSGAPCFETPTEGELVVGGRKLVGSAQYREQDAFLQHGSILIDDDQPMLSALLTVAAGAAAAASPTTPAATLRAALGGGARVEPDAVAAALFAAVREGEDALAGPLLLDAALVTAARLAAAHYAADAWTWRR